MFGRTDDVDRLFGQTISHTGLTAFVGASGVGKTSVLAAGLAPRLREHGYEVQWVNVLEDPVERLGPPARPHVVAVLDQAEQLFTPAVDAAAVAEALVRAVHQTTFAHIIVSFRSDHQPAFDMVPSLQRLIDADLVRLLPLDRAMWRAVIEKPAFAVGLSLEDGLVEVIERDVPSGPAGLPLLSVALRATWDRRYNGRLEVRGYRESGGVASALKRQAEEAYRLLDPSQRSLARWMFAMRLTQEAPSGLEPTRRRATMAELSSSSYGSAQDVVEAFRNARLLTVSGSVQDPETTVEIVHEALLRSWPRLADDWLREFAVESRRLQSWIADATREWVASDRSLGTLRTSAQIEAARSAVELKTLELTKDEVAFVQASSTERDNIAARDRSARRMRLVLIGVATVTVVLLAVAVAAVLQASRERNLRDDTQALRTAASARAAAPRQRDLAVLLALEGVRRWGSLDSWSALVDVLAAPGPSAFLRAPGSGPVADVLPVQQRGRTVVAVVDGGPRLRWLDPASGGEVDSALDTGLKIAEFLAAGPTGARIVAGSRSGELVELSVGDGGRTPLASGPPSRLRDVAVSPTQLFAVNEDGLLVTWSLSDPAAPPQLDQPFASGGAAAVAALGQDRVAIGSTTGELVLWSPQQRATVAGPVTVSPGSFVVGLAADRAGDRVAAIGAGNITIWDGTGEPKYIATSAASTAWLDDDQLIVGRPDGDISIVSVRLASDLGSGRTFHRTPVRRVLPLPDGGAVSVDDTGLAVTWSPVGQSPLATIQHLSSPTHDVVVDADGRPVTAPWENRLASASEGYLHLDPDRGVFGPEDNVLLTVPAGTHATELAARSVELVAIGLDNGDIVVKRRNNQLVLHVDGGQVRSLDISPDGHYLAAGAYDPTRPGARAPIALFDLPSGDTVRLDAHDLYVEALRFSPNGQSLASGSDDHTIIVWDVASRTPSRVLRGHDDLVTALAWADDRFLVSGGQDATVRFWDTRAGAAIGDAMRSGLGAEITDLAVSRGQVFAAQGNGLVVWPFGPVAWTARGCSMTARAITPAEWRSSFSGRPAATCPRFAARAPTM